MEQIMDNNKELLKSKEQLIIEAKEARHGLEQERRATRMLKDGLDLKDKQIVQLEADQETMAAQVKELTLSKSVI